MNKKHVAVFVLAGLVIVLSSFGFRNFVWKRSASLVGRSDSENRKSLLDLAEISEAKKDYPKARACLKRFIGKFPDSKDRAKIKRDIEALNIKILFSGAATDSSFLYKVKPGDTLAGIASRFNTTTELLKKSNHLKSDLILPGRFLKVNTAKFSIFIDKSENTLTLKKSGGETVKTYRVSTGKSLSTPEGTFKIEEKLISPTWYKKGAVVEPENPEYELGTRWMGLSEPEYGIHGTDDASSVGKHITKGCVRMRNKDVEELYAIVPAGTEVTIVE